MPINPTKRSLTISEDLASEFDAEELFLINPDETTVKTIVTDVFDIAAPRLRVLAEERVMKTVRRHFPFATKAADLVEDDGLEIRTVEALPRNSLVLGPDRAIMLVTDTENFHGVPTDSTDVVPSLTQGYAEAWANAASFDLRTPALSRIRDSLRDEFGESFSEEFDTTFEALEPVPRGEVGIDEVALVLLLTAKQEELLYDVGRWGEEIKLSSKASFSRVKQRLESTGLIETEKVPMDVGRPRLRLLLADEDLQGETGDTFVAKARERIEAGA